MPGESHQLPPTRRRDSFVAFVFILPTLLVAWAIAAGAQDSAVRINEVQSANDSTIETASGGTPDWIELLNSSPQTVDVSGWSLSDDKDEPGQWRFPPGTSIGANSTLLVFASDRDGVFDGELHTNFKLSSAGDYVGLFDAEGVVVSSVDQLPPLLTDTSWGLTSEGQLRLFGTPTPGSTNTGSSYAGHIPAVEFSQPRGIYTSPTTVSLTAIADATIRYTLDGSEPSLTRGSTYTEPITISATTVLRAAAFRTDWLAGASVAHTYVFPADVPDQSRMNAAAADASRAEIAQSLTTLPYISLTSMINGATPRFTWPTNSEAPVSVEMVLPDGRSTHIEAGAKEVGKSSISYAKDSLRLKFGSDWGESRLDFPVFDGVDNAESAVESFKRLTLRMGAHDTGFWNHSGGPHRSYLRAAWHDHTMLELGHPGIHTRFVNLFMNGQYWGLYQLREHPDDHFMASYLGGDSDDYLAVNSGVVTTGAGTSWTSFVGAADTWADLSQVVDPVNYVDFMLVSEYAGNSWDLRANNNWRAAARSAVGPDGAAFQFFHSDPDVAMVSIDGNMTLAGGRSNFHGPAGSWTQLHREKDPDFLQLVADRSEYLFSDGGALSPASAAARWAELEAEIADAVHGEWARWRALTPDKWQTGMDWFNTTYFPERTDRAVSLLRSKGHLTGPDFGAVPGPSVTAPESTDWLVGQSVSVTLSADRLIMRWSVDGLPPGVSLDPLTGQVSGVVASPGVFPLAVSALDYAGRPGGASATWTAAYPASSALVLNEWNAVSPDARIQGGDKFFGPVAGNGGDWFELVVAEDHIDVRGWSLLLSDADTDDGVREVTDVLVFDDDPLLADLRAGTIITISEDVADDTSFDPSAGDWTLNFQSTSRGAGAFFTADSQANFSTNHIDWQLLIRDSQGDPIFGPAGEGIGGVAGVGDAEVGELDADPTPSTNATSGYDDGDASTFGAANETAGVIQDLVRLRAWWGDANCDGTVDASDINAILSVAAGSSPSAGCDLTANGDLNSNGTVDLYDALMLARSLAQR